MTDVNNSVDKPSTDPTKMPVDNQGAPLVAEAKGTYVALPQHEIPAKVDETLVQMLCWPRDHNSPEEIAFSGWVKDYLTNTLKVNVTMMAEGAMSVTIPLETRTDGTHVHSTTLFSCHLDTVDSKMVNSESRKKLTYDPAFGTIALDSQSVGNCLGADDSAGIWLMFKMIEAGTPGTYLFHRGEERGGISAKAMAKGFADWLGKFSVAVAFDRKDTGDIVTVQGGARCASEKFSAKLAEMLNEQGFQYKESTTGSYTDVKEYRGLISECVNLSCGYDMAHSRGETLDYAHLAAMAEALPKVQWEHLPIDRDHKAKDPEPSWKRNGIYGFGNAGRLFDDDEDRQWGARDKGGKKTNGAKTKPKAPLVPVGHLPVADAFEDKGFEGMSWDEIEGVVMDDVTWSVEQIVKLMRENARLKADVSTMQRLLGL